jgi:hypothetical protein
MLRRSKRLSARIKSFGIRNQIWIANVKILKPSGKIKSPLNLARGTGDDRMADSIYVENGYANRKEYLSSLAEDYGVSISTVAVIADMLGPSEDFDGLVSALEDAEGL